MECFSDKMGSLSLSSSCCVLCFRSDCLSKQKFVISVTLSVILSEPPFLLHSKKKTFFTHISFNINSLCAVFIIISEDFGSWKSICVVGGGNLMILLVLLKDKKFGKCTTRFSKVVHPDTVYITLKRFMHT